MLHTQPNTQSAIDAQTGVTALRGYVGGRLRRHFQGVDYDLGRYTTEDDAREAAGSFMRACVSGDAEIARAAALACREKAKAAKADCSTDSIIPPAARSSRPFTPLAAAGPTAATKRAHGALGAATVTTPTRGAPAAGVCGGVPSTSNLDVTVDVVCHSPPPLKRVSAPPPTARHTNVCDLSPNPSPI